MAVDGTVRRGTRYKGLIVEYMYEYYTAIISFDNWLELFLLVRLWNVQSYQEIVIKWL